MPPTAGPPCPIRRLAAAAAVCAGVAHCWPRAEGAAAPPLDGAADRRVRLAGGAESSGEAEPLMRLSGWLPVQCIQHELLSRSDGISYSQDTLGVLHS